jgi:peroxiredoxin
MKFEKILFLIFICSKLLFGINKDTVVVKMERMPGYGSFGISGSPLSPMGKDNPWYSTIPAIKGVPDTLSNLMFSVFDTDFLQHAFQSYLSGKISRDFYNSCLESWGLKYEPDKYSKKFVKEAIAIAAGYNKKGELLVFVDENNNFDLSDDAPILIPPKSKKEKFSDRLKNIKPVDAEFEYYDGKQIRKGKVWLYIDVGFGPPQNVEKKNTGPVNLFIGIAQYFEGRFQENNIWYNIFAKNETGAVKRDLLKIKVSRNDTIDISKLSNDVDQSSDQYLKFGNSYFKITKIAPDGKFITLVKENVTSQTEAAQTGFKAPGFTAKTISGDEISLNSFKGKYVYLDFWGSWCMPCRYEIPGLKKIYKKYRNRPFTIIGIANDKKDNLEKFVKQNDVRWSQILQDKDKQIINEYNVQGYPTTFLIDTSGTILKKNLRSKGLEMELEKIFKN